MAAQGFGPASHFPITPHSAQSSRRSSRRSWFDTPPTTTLEIAVEKPLPKPPQSRNKRRSIDDIETLILTHFTKPPRIGFGKIILGRSKTRMLMIKNPNDYEQEVVVERFPFKRCFNVDQTSFLVGPGDVTSLTLTWTPQEAGSCREMVLFHINGVYRLQAYVFGTADDPKPPKKIRKGMLGARKTKQPLACVVQTPALNSIRDSYSPRRSEETRELRAKLQRHQAKLAEQENVQPLEQEMVPQTPPPLESTAICKNDELQQNTAERRKSGFSSPTLTRMMSPIPVTADNDNGCIVESPFFLGSDQTHLPREKMVSAERSPLKSVSLDGNNKLQPSSQKTVILGAQRRKSNSQQIVQSPFIAKEDAVGCESPQRKIMFAGLKQCVSPNSFLNESVASKKPSTPEVGIIKSSKQVSQVKEMGVTSPNSFLEDLNRAKNALKGDSETEKAASPSTVLNSSVPHNILLHHLETVRTSFHDGSFHAETKTTKVLTSKTTLQRKKGGKTQQEKITHNVFAYAHSRDAASSKKEKFLHRKIQEKSRFTKIADAPSPRRKTFLVKKKSARVSPAKTRNIKTMKDTSQKGILLKKQEGMGKKCTTKVDSENSLAKSNQEKDKAEVADGGKGKTKRRRSQWASPAVTGFIPPIFAANPDCESPVHTGTSAAGHICDPPEPLISPEVDRDDQNDSATTTSTSWTLFQDSKMPEVVPAGDVLTGCETKFGSALSPCESAACVLSSGTTNVLTSDSKTKPSCESRDPDGCLSAGRKLFPDVSVNESFNEASFRPLWAGNSGTVTKERPSVSPHSSGMGESSGRKLFPDLGIQDGMLYPDKNVSNKDADVAEKNPGQQEGRNSFKTSDFPAVGFQFSSPKNLPTSPSAEATRRGTLTVTKLRPSQALMDAELRKDDSVSHKDSTEKVEGIQEQKVTEEEEEPWITETVIIEQRGAKITSISFHRDVLTPTTELPTSPKSEKSRRSTHAVRNPVVLNKEGVVRKTLFTSVPESRNMQENENKLDTDKHIIHRVTEEVSDTTSQDKMSDDEHRYLAVFTDRVEQHLNCQQPTRFQKTNISTGEVRLDVSLNSQNLSVDSLESEGKINFRNGKSELDCSTEVKNRTVPQSYVPCLQRNVTGLKMESPDSIAEAIMSDSEPGVMLRKDPVATQTLYVAGNADASINSLPQKDSSVSVNNVPTFEEHPPEQMTKVKPVLEHRFITEKLLKESEASKVKTKKSSTALFGAFDGLKPPGCSNTKTGEQKLHPAAAFGQLHANITKPDAFTVMEEKQPKLRRAVSAEIAPRAEPLASGLQQTVSQTGLRGKTKRTYETASYSRQTAIKGSSKERSGASQPGMEAFNVNGKRLSPEAAKGEPRKKRVELDAAAGGRRVGKPLLSVAASGKSGRGARAVKGVAQSRLLLVKKPKTAPPKHPLPFAAKNMYYDERWQDKQERGFVHWLNFVLTPADEYALATTKKKVDARSIAFDGPANRLAPRLAPTKEVLSFRAYAAQRRLNHLRRASCRLFQSEEVARVVCRIELEVESRRLAVRADRMIHADIGIKQRILDTLLSYNPLWLRIGLETVYGEMLQLHSNSDVIGMSRFILTRLLNSPDISAQYAHPTVPHLYQDGYADAVAQHTLKKFLLLVYFLDCAKRSRLIAHDPCLFCKDSEVKSTKEVLVQFSRDYLSGEGDVTKHLAYMGYVVSHVQTPLDEFDYAVTNLCTDLRDGVRLGRIVMLLSGDWGMASSLRAPAISRLQKIHNIEVVFRQLTDRGFDLSTTKGSVLNPRDVVDGHREKTLAFLWKLIFHFQAVASLNESELQEEVGMLERTLRVKLCMQRLLVQPRMTEGQARRDSGALAAPMESPMLQLLLKWSRMVCLHYGVKVENFTVSFSDGRALCCLVHHYHPTLLPLDKIRFQTSQSYQEAVEAAEEGTAAEAEGESDMSAGWGTSPFGGEMDPELFDRLLANERENFKILYEKVSELGGIPLMLKAADMSNTIPDERVVITYVSYMCARLLDLREETRAARVIQLAWRRFCLRRSARERQRKIAACVTIQRTVRVYLARVHAERKEAAAVLIQATWRGHKDRRRVALLRKTQVNRQLHDAATTLQTQIRCYLARRRYLQGRAAAITIQSWIRRFQAQLSFDKQRQACLLIQSCFRAHQRMVAARREFLSQKHAAVVLQRAFRIRQNRNLEQRVRAACVLQSAWRGLLCRKDFMQKRQAVTRLQAWWRMVQARWHFLRLKSASRVIQERFRAVKQGAQTRAEFLQARSAAVTIQKVIRGHQKRCQYKTQRKSAILIQKRFRCYKYQVKFQALRLASTVIQRAVRAHQARRRAQEEYLRLRGACIIIQKWYRRQKEHQAARREEAAVRIQSHFRGRLARRELQVLQLRAQREAAARKVQAFVRSSLVRRKYQKLRRSVVLLQTYTRSCQARQKCAEMREALSMLAEYTATQDRFQLVVAELHQRWSASVCIQSWWRGCFQQKMYHVTRAAAVKIQSAVRSYLQRKRFVQLVKSVIFIQRKFRQVRRVRAAVKVQAWWHMCMARNHFQITKRSIVCIQAAARMLIATSRYRRLRQAAVCFQRQYRAQRLGRSVRLQYQLTLGAAVVFQSCWKMHVVRRCYLRLRGHVTKAQAHCRRYLVEKRYQRMRTAAVCIQRRYRAHLLGHQERKKYQAMQQAVVCLQAFDRGLQQRRRFLAARNSCITIQAAVRRWLAVRRYQQQRCAVITLQQRLRARLRSRRAQIEYRATRQAVIRLQAFARGCLQRSRYLATQKSCIRIQSAVKRWLAMRSYRQQYACILFMQRRWRAVLAGRQAQAEYCRSRRAIVHLQAHVRGLLQRRQYLAIRKSCITVQSAAKMRIAVRHYRAQKQAATLLQRRWRAMLSGRKVRNHCAAMQKAVVTLQAVTRGFLTRKRLSQHHQAATTIQTSFRRWHAQRTFHQQIEAALTLQRHIRSFLLSRRQQKEYAAVQKACVTLQACYRGHAARLQYQKMRSSAVKIQACLRAYQQRRKYRTLYLATVICQRRYRAKYLAQVFRVAFLLIREASIVIQKHARGYIARKHYQEQRSAALVLQAHTRGWLCRREITRKQEAACVLQRRVRAWLTGRVTRQAFLLIRWASVVLQRAWRQHKEREKEQKNAAATVIQKHFRRRSAQKQYQNQVSKIVHLQACVRKFISRRVYKAKKLAAVKIQKRWRETLAAQACRRSFLLQVGAAVVIQAAFRGYCVRGYYITAMRKVVHLQAAFRGCIQKRRYQKLRQTVLCLQRRIRSNALARQDRKNFLRLRTSAVCVQRAFRRWQERQLTRKLQAVTCLQSHLRRKLAQREYARKRSAAVTIQAAVRTHRARHMLLKKRSAIITIQTQVRFFLMVRQLREEVQRRRFAAATIQRVYRRHHARKRQGKLERLRESICRTQAAVRLQRVVRRWLDRKRLAEAERRKSAAITVQRSFRAWRSRVQAAEEQERQQRAEFLGRFAAAVRQHLAVVKIQRWHRRLLLMRQAEERLHSIVVLQGWVRTFLQRRRFIQARKEAQALQERREMAAHVIQAAMRRWSARQTEKKRERLITKVQAMWRGRRLRRSLKSKKIAAARQRVHEANQAATEEKKLGNRTSSALDFLLHYKQLAYILDALMHLDVATRLSAVCCERLVEVNAVRVIFRLIQSCNRSLPHMELIKFSISILLNLTKYEKTTQAVYVVEDSVSTLVDLMSIYREKGGTIFSKTCMLLSILGLDSERRAEMCADKRLVEKLQSIHVLVLRKHRMQVARARQVARTSLNATLPSRLYAPRAVKVRPAWVLRRDSLHEIEDPMAALAFLLDTLHIGPKH